MRTLIAVRSRISSKARIYLQKMDVMLPPRLCTAPVRVLYALVPDVCVPLVRIEANLTLTAVGLGRCVGIYFHLIHNFWRNSGLERTTVGSFATCRNAWCNSICPLFLRFYIKKKTIASFLPAQGSRGEAAVRHPLRAEPPGVLRLRVLLLLHPRRACLRVHLVRQRYQRRSLPGGWLFFFLTLSGLPSPLRTRIHYCYMHRAYICRILCVFVYLVFRMFLFIFCALYLYCRYYCLFWYFSAFFFVCRILCFFRVPGILNVFLCIFCAFLLPFFSFLFFCLSQEYTLYDNATSGGRGRPTARLVLFYLTHSLLPALSSPYVYTTAIYLLCTTLSIK